MKGFTCLCVQSIITAILLALPAEITLKPEGQLLTLAIDPIKFPEKVALISVQLELSLLLAMFDSVALTALVNVAMVDDDAAAAAVVGWIELNNELQFDWLNAICASLPTADWSFSDDWLNEVPSNWMLPSVQLEVDEEEQEEEEEEEEAEL